MPRPAVVSCFALTELGPVVQEVCIGGLVEISGGPPMQQVIESSKQVQRS